jgi:MSHA pilin protein MshD
MCINKTGFGSVDLGSRGALSSLAPQSSILNPQKGISLIELIMFIVIVSVALAGILLVMNVVTKNSADPLIHKQAMAIAESLIEEVELMPFTICDPNDVNAASAVTSADCTGGTNGANDESKVPLGPEAGEARGSLTLSYDNVSDYNGFSMAGAGITDIAGNPIGGLSGYTASVAVGTTGCAGIMFPNALPITVTVTGPDNLPIVLDGCRTRYSPRSVP